ncbi:unnamed protein product [Gongylonema pulchrum]|uniref:Uncharacterized protein n=1 Tax=Gongylonema pulchrum TaxID=637853 RepID=A0A183ED46_9BILA|nr:unnamed protein product [Gongylonema pulchrum]
MNWRSVSCENEETQETDYVEAEIESTDTLQPLPNELFGEQLLTAKFRLADSLEKPAVRSGSAIGRDEMATPPGTVPQSQSRRTSASTASRISVKAKQQPVTPAIVMSTANDSSRPDSVSSQQTFVLENSRRRPLVARDPFKIGFNFPKFH